MNVTTMKNLLQDIRLPDDSKRQSLNPYRRYLVRLKKDRIKEFRILCSHLTCMAGIPDHANGTKRNNKRNGPEGI